jgi:hypothetical protein
MPAKKQIERAEQAASELGENIAEHFKTAMDSANDWKDTAQTYIKKNPGIALAGAFFLGVVVAKVARHA